MVLIAQGREMIRKNARRVLYFLCLVFLLTACSAVSNPETDALIILFSPGASVYEQLLSGNAKNLFLSSGWMLSYMDWAMIFFNIFDMNIEFAK